MGESQLALGNVYVEYNKFAMKLSNEITIENETEKNILNLNLS